MRLSFERIVAARELLGPEFRDSPQYVCEPLGQALGCTTILKVETMNPLRSFKGRGSQISIEEARRQGYRTVVCASAGNLGQAVAYCARARGMSAVVYASRDANALKLKRITELGATLRLVHGDIEHARSEAQIAAEEDRAYLIEDSENIAACEGAATIGCELIDDQATTLDAVMISLGGGALATGVGYVFKRLSPSTSVICVQPEGAPAMTLSWRSKRVVNTETIDTIADGVAGRFPIAEVLEDLLEVADDALLVEESSIVRAMQLIYRHAGLVVEPSAALGVAAMLENASRFAGQQVGLIVCGSNVDADEFNRWVGRQQS